MAGKRHLVGISLAITCLTLAAAVWGLFSGQPPPTTQPPLLTALNHEQTMGKVNKSMFPYLTAPSYVPAAKVQFLNDDDEVLLVRGKSEVRAYPVVVMGWHHIVNDEMDGEPYAMTYCLLVDTAVTFSRRMGKETLSLGVLGTLFYGDMVMFDKESDSQFLQITGDAFTGPQRGKRLQVWQRSERMSWRRAKEISNLRVLPTQRDTEYYRVFWDMNKDAAHGLRTLEARKVPLDSRLVPLSRGLALALPGDSLFAPFAALDPSGVINEEVAGHPVMLAFDSATGRHMAWWRTVEGKVLTFGLVNGELHDAETQSRWGWDGKATSGPLSGKSLPVASETIQIFWYAWHAFFPTTRILTNGASGL